MRYTFNSAERRADLEFQKRKKKEEVEKQEKIVKDYMQEVSLNGITYEQRFLLKYYGLKRRELPTNFSMENVEQFVYDQKSEISAEQLESDRYEALIKMFSVIQGLDDNKVRKHSDMFHSDINRIEDYVKTFLGDPLIVKKMRNLQMLNRVAHTYTAIFKTIIYNENPQLNTLFTENKKRIIENNIETMFSVSKNISESAKRKLIEQLDEGIVKKIKNNKAIKYCTIANNWMFRQKYRYITEILQDLQNTDEKYNYGILKDALLFDVPGYGQFSVHMGKNNTSKMESLRQLYGVGEYEGEYLGDVYILSKANPELLKNVNYEELSDLDKQRYRIAVQGIEEKEQERVKEGKNVEDEKEENNLESMIENTKDKEKALKIVQVIRDAGIAPETVVTKTLLDKGKPEAIKDVIEVISQNKYGIGLDILTRCKTLLSVNQEKAIDIMEMLDKIDKLGIDPNIIIDYPTFLTVSKSNKIEPIYETLKQYRIDLTNHNLGAAFGSTAQNIKKNMDLLIENGLYYYAQAGVNKFFTSNNKSLNMRLNLLKMHKEPSVTEGENKRRLNATLYKSEKYLMEKYGIDKKDILEELSKIQGQELIKDNKYYSDKEDGDIPLTEKQQEISNSIYDKLKENEIEKGIVIKIGDYYYSTIKVKEQIDEIIVNSEIKDLENENINEILEVALFKNKNITQKEVEEVSKQLEEITKEEMLEQEMPEQEILESEVSEQEVAESEMPERGNIEPESELLVEKSSEVEKPKDSEETQEAGKNISGYEDIRNMTGNIVEKQQSLNTINQVINHLKETRRKLKAQIKEMEDKVNKSILESEEPNSELIQDIEKMRAIISQQKEKRKEVKQMIKKYRENKKIMKYMLKQEKSERDEAIDNLEL